MNAEPVKPQTVQGITVLETPIKTEFENGDLVFYVNDFGLRLKNLSFADAQAVKEFVDHVYKIALDKGFQIATNKNEDGSKSE